MDQSIGRFVQIAKGLMFLAVGAGVLLGGWSLTVRPLGEAMALNAVTGTLCDGAYCMATRRIETPAPPR